VVGTVVFEREAVERVVEVWPPEEVAGSVTQGYLG
jgi:hypothetical protein